MRKIHWMLGLLLCGMALFASGCGAKQTNQKIANIAWPDLYDAVPSDAAFALGFSIPKEEPLSAMWHESVRSVATAEIIRVYGQWRDAELLAGGEVAFFRRPGQEWFIAKLDDVPSAMTLVAQQYETLPTYEEDRQGDRPQIHFQEPTALYDIVGTQRYVIMVRRDAASATDEDAVVALVEGWPSIGRYAQKNVKLAPKEAMDSAQPHGWFFADVKNYNAVSLVNAQNMPGKVWETHKKCHEENARIATAVPGIQASLSTDKSGYKHVVGRIPLSDAAQTRAKQLMPGAPSIDAIFKDALAALSVSFDYGQFFEGLRVTTEVQACYGVAGLAAEIAGITQRFDRDIRFNAKTVSGTGAVVLQNVGLDGFIPTFEGGVYIDSPSAEGLFIRLSRKFAKLGRVDNVPDASVPTVTATLQAMPMKIRIQNVGDRVVLASENLADATVVALKALPPHADSQTSLRFKLSGKLLARLAEEASEFVADMEMDDPRVDEAMSQVKAIQHGIDARLFFDNAGLRFVLDENDD